MKEKPWSGRFSQDTDSLVVFRIDPSTGHLTPTGQKEQIGSPVCVVFEPLP